MIFKAREEVTQRRNKLLDGDVKKNCKSPARDEGPALAQGRFFLPVEGRHDGKAKEIQRAPHTPAPTQLKREENTVPLQSTCSLRF